jgi:CRP-like cAMP-binding protein
MADQFDDESAIADQLKTVPLFAGLEESDRLAAVRAGRIADFSPGDAITLEGAAADHFFVLLSGEATVSVAAEEDAIDVGVARPGDTLGEFGALLRTPRTATVTAIRRCRALRFNHASLEALFASSPRFGLALSRELAQRLKQALLAKNEMQLDHLPEKIVLDPPDITRMREYMVTYYATALKHVIKQHRLVSDRHFPVYETTFMLSPEEHSNWLKLFDTADLRTPFTYHTTVGTMALMRVVGDIGVNFRNLMHLKCEMGMARDHLMEPGHTYRLVSQVEDIIALRDDRVVLVCASRIVDLFGFQLRNYRDFFVILNLEPHYVDLLRSAKNYGHRDVDEFQSLASRRPTLADTRGLKRVPIYIPEDMGFAYGKVSGDLNLVHTTKLAAQIFGHPRPFIQGLCTANYALRYLTEEYGPPEAMRVTFAKRVFVGQQIELRLVPSRFEICDSQGVLLAFGDFS